MSQLKYHRCGPGPESYSNFAFCVTCELRLPKDTLYCPECNYRVRSKPRAAKARRRMEKAGLIKRY